MNLEPISLREAAMFVWEHYLNVPYKWGGDDPMAGVDCSGLIIEGLASVGLIPRKADYTAHQLLNVVFADRDRLAEDELVRGCLLFWKRGRKIGHVEIVWAVIGQRVLTIGASGGGSRTTDRAQAIKENSYVKIRRATTGWTAAVDPF